MIKRPAINTETLGTRQVTDTLRPPVVNEIESSADLPSVDQFIIPVGMLAVEVASEEMGE
jgi:hypothetical protein